MSVAAEDIITGLDVPKVLWVDDDSDAIESYKLALLSQGDVEIDIQIARTIREARTLLDEREYASIVIDCRMDPYNMSENGAEFLRELNLRRKYLPTFVYSGFLDDPHYKDIVAGSYAILVESKLDEFERPLARDPFFQAIIKTSTAYWSVKDLFPERIPFNEYVNNPANWSLAVEAHWEKHGHWIDMEMERNGYAWCVVCGEEIVECSKSPFTFPTEDEILRLGRTTNLIPFAYSATMTPEEDSPSQFEWKATKYPEDYYPQVRLKIGDRSVDADFDSGAVRTYVSEELIKKSPFNFFRKGDSGRHLDEDYRFFSTTATVAVLDSTGNEKSANLVLSVVQDWRRTSFVEVNPKRICLVGRDLFHSFDLRIELDSRQRSTRVFLYTG